MSGKVLMGRSQSDVLARAMIRISQTGRWM